MIHRRVCTDDVSRLGRISHLVGVGVLLLAVAACGGEPSSDDGDTSDVAADTELDAGVDVVADAELDVVSDADTSTDVADDATIDAPSDIAVDADLDATPDGDATPDSDVTSDVVADASVCVDDDGCDLGEQCVAGTCEPQLVCEPSTTFCDSGAVLLCNDNGQGAMLVDCESAGDCGEFGCGCDAGACAPRVCDAGTSQCMDDTVETCSDDGLAWDVVETCAAAFYCQAGACVPDACLPAEQQCSDDILLTCSDTGDTWLETDCTADNNICDADLAACAPPVCTPGTRQCNDDGDAEVCADAGNAWDVEPCDAGTQVCSAGSCVPRVCTPGSGNLCMDDEVVRCNADGTAFLNIDTCDADEQCTDGQCAPTLCEPDEAACNGNDLHVCDADGDATTTPCGNGTCNATEQRCDPPIACSVSRGDVCYGNIAYSCTSGSLAVIEPCDAAEYCAEGACLPSCEATGCAVDDPYGGATDEALLGLLRAEHNANHIPWTYRETREFFWANSDNDGGVVTCVYTNFTLMTPGLPANGDIMNTEHTWPRSGGVRDTPAEADMHHLFPTRSDANNRRGSFPFCDVSNSVSWDDVSTLGDNVVGLECFEPQDSHKGNVARAMFYVSAMYNLRLDPAQEIILRGWHLFDEVDADEVSRNVDAAGFQGSANPFITHPDLVWRVANF